MEKVNLSIKLKNRLDELDKIKAAVSEISASTDCTRRDSKEINLILEEIFTNVVNYGFDDDKEHDINLSLSCDECILLIRIEDDGKPFDFTATADPDTKCPVENRCIGGLGIHFVKHFMDDCKYYRNKGKNIVVLKKDMTNDE
ncbi:MAG: ATP-binding protein [Deltaproteobacteria bacterium]|nr:ATP-binding protein [Deltaproteobacteria bacterium]